MMSAITWYDVLGVLPDAPPEDIRAAWQARKALLQSAALAGAPPDARPAADRARHMVDEAWGALGDPAARASYDAEIGFARPGEGLAPPWRGPSIRSAVSRARHSSCRASRMSGTGSGRARVACRHRMPSTTSTGPPAAASGVGPARPG